jgi:large repetitive protein
MQQSALRARTYVVLALIGLALGIFGQPAAAAVDEGAAPPVAGDDVLETRVDKAAFVFVLENDTDADEDELEVTTAAPPAAHGTVSCGMFGLCEYTPASGYVGTDGFDYTISDGSETDVGHVSITVFPNTPPVAVDDELVMTANSTETVFVLDNDTDADEDGLTITTPAPTAAHGTVACDEFSCTYTPTSGYTGPDGFDYTMSDGLATDVGHVSIQVNANTPPVAVDDNVLATSGRVTDLFPLFNDTDADGDELELTTATDPPHGTVSCQPSGTCEYTPDTGYVGADSFDYTISDGDLTDIGHVSIQVNPNGPPDAVDDTLARQDQVSVHALGNDTDPEGDELTITSVTQPSHGTAVIADGGFFISYTATGNFSASDSFTYTVSDGFGGTDTATVTLNPCPSLASALDGGGLVTSERWVVCSSVTANGSVGPLTTVLPPSGGASALFTSGDVSNAPGPNDSSGAGTDNNTQFRGAIDVSILRLDIQVPPAANCLSFELAFQSEEYPEYVNQAFNDGFLAELDVSDWVVNGADIEAPHNFAFDGQGGIVSVNGSFFEPDRVVTDTGSQYDGSTPRLTVQTPVTPGAHQLYLSIFDAGDGILDSGAFVDRLQAGAAGPAGCAAGANEPPVAVDDTLTTAEDTAGQVSVLTNDSDPDGHALTVTTLTPTAQHGTVSCTAAGVCTYTPAANYFGPDSFTYGISDGHGGTDTATVTVTVTPVNDPPEANADVIDTTEGSPGSANVLANDFDADGDTLTIQSFTQGLHGTVTCAGTDCTYTPNAGYSGPDSFTYTASDGHGGTDVATVAVTVSSANDPPVADDDALMTAEDTPGQVNVLDGDTDPNGDPLTVSTLTPSAGHGTVSCTAAGVCTYTPDANYFGPDSFTYTVSDGHGGTDTGTVNVTVTPVNDAPNAVDDVLTTAEDAASAPLNVLANDTDIDGGPLSVTTLTPTANHGTVSCTAAGLCTYMPAASYFGPDSFDYSISDGNGGTDTATVNVTVTPVNDAPNAVDDVLTTAEDAASAPLNVLANDSDVDGDALAVTTLTPTASHGTVSCTAAGSCTYTPALNYNGPDSFTYSISDGNGGSDTATVSFTVTPVNDAPTAVDDSLTTAENTAGNVNVLANDTDVESDTLTVTTLAPTATHGTVSCLAGGQCTYTPNAGFSGLDSFTYSISDGNGGSDSATVNVTVTPNVPTNTPPVADDETLTTPEDLSDSVDVLSGDTDADGDTLTVTSLSPTAAHGTVTCAASGTCQYTPAANYHGPDGFDYTISDGRGGTDTGHVSITVTPLNDPPVADDELLTTNEDTSGNVNVLAGDTDVDGDTLTVTTLTPTAAHGTVSCTAAGVCTYTPAADYSGPDSFDYTVSDGNGGTDTGTVSVTVTPVNDPPVADDEALTTAEDTPSDPLDVLAGDTDVDGGPLTVPSLSPAAAHGTVSCTAAGMCTYTPAANYHGTDSFDYTVSDGNGGTDTGTVSVTVTPVPDAPDAVDDTLTTPEDTAGNVNVLANDADGDGDTLTVTTLAPTATNGTVACTAGGVCTYTPNAGFTGSDSFSYSISDGNGGNDTATVLVTVSADTNAPPSCANVKPSKRKLWPPRHKLVLITLAGATDPDGDPLTFSITKVTQDEKVRNATGPGDKAPDAKRVPGHPNQIKLRAERKGSGNGRVYRIFYTVSDGQGGTCSGVEKVRVPKKKNGKAIDDTDRSYNSFG